MTEHTTPIVQPPPLLARIRVDQYHTMVESGAFGDGQPMELLDGLLVYKDRSARGEDPMTVGRRHRLVVQLLAGLDPVLLRNGGHMQIQGPVSIPPHHEPEPDGAVVRGDKRDYATRHPGPADVVAVIEVADGSLESDRTRKLAIYAGAGIQQYVLVNLVDERLEVFDEPVPGEQRYARLAVLAPGEVLRLRTPLGTVIELPSSDLLP